MEIKLIPSQSRQTAKDILAGVLPPETSDREISLLKTQIRGFEAALDIANSKAIASNLDAFKGAVDEAVNPVLLRKIEERDRLIEILKANVNASTGSLAFCSDVIDKRDREIETLNERCTFLTNLLETECSFSKKVGESLGLNDWNSQTEVLDAIAKLKTDYINIIEDCKKEDSLVGDRDRQIQELQISLKNHHEQFDNLKSHFEVTLKAIVMNLNALKGDRKPDRIEEVDGVKVQYREYGNSLTHNQKTLIIEHQQRAIAEEAKKLKGLELKHFSFDEMPF